MIPNLWIGIVNLGIEIENPGIGDLGIEIENPGIEFGDLGITISYPLLCRTYELLSLHHLLRSLLRVIPKFGIGTGNPGIGIGNLGIGSRILGSRSFILCSVVHLRNWLTSHVNYATAVCIFP